LVRLLDKAHVAHLCIGFGRAGVAAQSLKVVHLEQGGDLAGVTAMGEGCKHGGTGAERGIVGGDVVGGNLVAIGAGDGDHSGHWIGP